MLIYCTLYTINIDHSIDKINTENNESNNNTKQLISNNHTQGTEISTTYSGLEKNTNQDTKSYNYHSRYHLLFKTLQAINLFLISQIYNRYILIFVLVLYLCQIFMSAYYLSYDHLLCYFIGFTFILYNILFFDKKISSFYKVMMLFFGFWSFNDLGKKLLSTRIIAALSIMVGVILVDLLANFTNTISISNIPIFFIIIALFSVLMLVIAILGLVQLMYNNIYWVNILSFAISLSIGVGLIFYCLNEIRNKDLPLLMFLELLYILIFLVNFV